jgi:hypothetical protein
MEGRACATCDGESSARITGNPGINEPVVAIGGPSLKPKGLGDGLSAAAAAAAGRSGWFLSGTESGSGLGDGRLVCSDRWIGKRGVHSRQRPRALHVDHRGSAAEVSVRVVEPEGAGHPLHQRQ